MPYLAHWLISDLCRHRHSYSNGSATREDKRRAGQEKTRGGQDAVTEPGHRVQGRGQSVCPGLVSKRTRGGQQQDKRRTRGGQDPDTEPGHRVQGRGQDKDKRRTRGGQDPDTEPGHRARPQRSGARPVSVASSFFPR